jgi:hypothetical protein
MGLTVSYYLIKYEVVKYVSYDKLIVKPKSTIGIENKRILILGDEIEGYLGNKLATPFFNWELASVIFEQPDRYEHVIVINNYFERDAPEIIIDRTGLMPKVFDRIPQWKEKYRRNSEGNYILISN